MTFDANFMGEDVYDKGFTVVVCDPEDVPAEKEIGKKLGGNIEGNRIGFDLGASDRKVAAVVDGEPVFSEETVWEPRIQSDPEYHYEEILAGLNKARSKLPQLDAIGGSAAGVYINNRVRVASLFTGIPEEKYARVRDMFLRIREEMGVPFEIVNDGDVTALAGSMSLEDTGILGIAMGSSEAAGYVNPEGNITGWLNELAFAPVDYNPDAPVDDWSRDSGVGAKYFSQQCVFRLAEEVGIDVPQDVTKAEKLESVQEKLEAGDSRAIDIWRTMGTYLGYTLAHYSDFYDLNHVLVLGRCTSGSGGNIMIDGAKEVLGDEFPELSSSTNIQLPDEKSRRVGQSIAAASLPEAGSEDS